jgi:phage terminase large subunit-like protein
LIFPWGEDAEGHQQYRLWPYFFLPEESARKTRHLVRWFDWERDGHLQITDDATTDFPLIRRAVVQASKKFDLRSVAYDDRFAETIAQELLNEDRIEMVEFNQTPNNFLEPIGLFENLVKSGRIRHPKNGCMDWQVGNAVKNRKGMLDKPEHENHKKIDGVTASLQGLGLAMQADPESVYETRGVLTIGEVAQPKQAANWFNTPDWEDNDD